MPHLKYIPSTSEHPILCLCTYSRLNPELIDAALAAVAVFSERFLISISHSATSKVHYNYCNENHPSFITWLRNIKPDYTNIYKYNILQGYK